MLWAVTASLYPLNCLGFDSCWAKQCLRRVLRAWGSPLQMDSRSWGAHMLYSVSSHLSLWQHKCSVLSCNGQNFGGEKIIYKSWWFPSILHCRSQGACIREEKEMSCSGIGQEVSSVLNTLNTAMGLFNLWSCGTGRRGKCWAEISDSQ